MDSIKILLLFVDKTPVLAHVVKKKKGIDLFVVYVLVNGEGQNSRLLCNQLKTIYVHV